MGNAGPLTDLHRALACAEAIVAGVRPDQWTASTLCDVDVRTLVEHLVAGNLAFAALLRAGALPSSGELGGDLLRDDPVAAFRRAGAELADAFATPGALTCARPAPPGVVAPDGTAGGDTVLGDTVRDGTVRDGAVRGADLLRVRLVEILGHGWDIARATAQPADFPDDLAKRVLEAAQQAPKPPPGPGASFAPEVPVPDGAPAIDRLAGFLGRKV